MWSTLRHQAVTLRALHWDCSNTGQSHVSHCRPWAGGVLLLIIGVSIPGEPVRVGNESHVRNIQDEQ